MSAPNLEFRVVSPFNEELGFLGSMDVYEGVVLACGGTYHVPTVLGSTDGTHFYERMSPDTPGLRHIHMVSHDRVVLVGEYGGIWTSDDLCKTFERRDGDFNGCIYALTPDRDGALWVGGDKGFVTRSTDEGETWTKVKNSIKGRVLAISHTETHTYLYGDGLYRCGKDLKVKKVELDCDNPLTQLAETHTGTLMLIGDGGTAFRSTDQGDTWDRVDVGTAADLEDLALVGPYAEEDGILIVGAESTVLYSNDDGISFEPIEVDVDAHLWSVAPSGTGGFIGGEGGIVLRFNEPGDKTWEGRADKFDEPGPLDDVFLRVEPEAFLDEGFENVFPPVEAAEQDVDDQEELEEDDDDEEDGDEPSEVELAARRAFELLSQFGGADDFAAVWGQAEPGELTRAREVLTSADQVYGFLHEWSPSLEVFPDLPEQENLFELIVLRDQQAYLGTGLSEAFCGLVCVGSLGNGDSYHLHAIATTGEYEFRPVMFFNHETHDLEWAFANSLSTLAYVSALCQARSNRAVSEKAYKKAFAKLSGKVALSWHYEGEQSRAALEEFKNFELEEQVARFYFYRSLWLVFLFRNDGVVSADEISGHFVADLNDPMTEEQVERWLTGAKDWAPTCLYLMWRCWFFGNEQLSTFLSIGREHKSRLVRDAAKLIDELEGGRKQLGSIEDMHAVRERVRALDLDPNRKAEREQEANARLEGERNTREQAFALVTTAVKDGDDLQALAWSHIEDPWVTEAIANHLRTDESLEQSFAIIDWCECNGGSHDGLILDHELAEACEAFGELGDDRVVPLLVSSMLTSRMESDEPEPEEDTGEDDQPKIVARAPRFWNHGNELLAFAARARSLDTRVAEAIRPRLEVEEKHEHGRARVVSLIAALRDEKSIPKCVELLQTKRLDEDFTADIRYGDLIKNIIRLLGDVDVPASREALHWLLEQTDDEYQELHPMVCNALVKLGDEAALPALVGWMGGDEEADPELLWAAAGLGGASAVEAIESANVDDGLTEQIARAVSLARCGQEVSELQELVERGFVEPAWDGDATTLRHMWALRGAGFCEAISTETIRAFMARDDANLRRAAADALTQRGEPGPEPARWYQFVLSSCDDDTLVAGLRDPMSIYGYNIALHLAKTGAPNRHSATIEFARRYVELAGNQYDDSEMAWDVQYPLRWAIKALTVEPNDEAFAFLNELLQHPSREVKDPVLRTGPPKHPALIPGMLQVKSEKWGWMESRAKEWLSEFKGTEAYKAAVKARQ